jgi:hypothetical protein
VKLKNIVLTVGALSVAVAGSAFAHGQSMNAQIQDLQHQVANLQQQVSQMGAGHSNGGSAMGGFVHTNAKLSSAMMSNFRGVDNDMLLLMNTKNMAANSVAVGGYMQAGVTWGQSSDELYNNGTSRNQTNVTLDHVAFSVTGKVGQNVMGYIQAGVNNLGVTASGQTSNDKPAFHQAFLLLGNANEPLYAYVGRKDVDFGNFSSVNMFAQPLTRQFFQVNANAIAVGYHGNFGGGAHMNLVLTALNGGANGQGDLHASGIWNTFIPGSAGVNTKTANQLNNYAANLSLGMSNGGVDWNVGAGWINGIGYSTTTTNRVGAWDLNAQASMGALKLLAEYDATFGNAGTYNNNVPGAIAFGGRISAWNVAAEYSLPSGMMMMPNATVASLSYSGVNAGGNSTSSNQTINQFVLGLRNEVFPKANLWAGIEYAYQRFSGTNYGTVSNNNVRLDLTTNF